MEHMSRVRPGQDYFDPSRKGDANPVARDQLAEELRGNDIDDLLDHIDPPSPVPEPTADERIAGSEAAQKLTQKGRGPARTTLEAEAIEGYRSGALTSHQTRRLLGFDTRYELDGFLKAHNVWERAYSLEDLEQDRRTMQRLEAEGRLKA
jgi:hypothetical protein